MFSVHPHCCVVMSAHKFSMVHYIYCVYHLIIIIIIAQRVQFRPQHHELRSPAEDASVSSVFSVSSALEPLCSNVLFKLALMLLIKICFPADVPLFSTFVVQ